jgi:hypothetical protein
MAPALARAALALAPGFLAAEAGGVDSFLIELLEQALDALEPAERGLAARLTARLALALQFSEGSERRAELVGHARVLAEGSDDVVVKLNVLHARWLCEWNHLRFREREAIANEMLCAAEAVRDREMMLLGMLFRMIGMMEHGDICAFDIEERRFRELAGEVRQPQSLWYSEMLLGMRALSDGDLSRAEVHARRSTEVAESVADANAVHSFMAQTALLKWERGELASIVDALTAGVSQYPWVPGWRAGLAWVLANLDRRAAAAHEFEVLSKYEFRDIPERFDWATAVAFLSDTCWYLRDKERARLLLSLLEPLSDRFLVLGLGVANLGPASRYLALLYDLLGSDQLASSAYEAAIAKCHSGGARAWAARCEFEHARFLLSRERSRDLALELIARAHEMSDQLGLVALCEQTRHLLNSLKSPPGFEA